MNYSEVCAHLDSLQMHKIKLGLEAMQAFLEKVGNPQQQLRMVHLAGTNGKGSVCEALRMTLGAAGYRVGCYTSPHLSSPRERFRVGEEFISEEAFARLGSRIVEVLAGEQITWFEFTTALGLLWFAEMECDLVVLETGMGGRLDATNVVLPLLCVITSISMDHEAWLGDTIAAIAGEKAGIIKPGVPVICGADGEAAEVIATTAREKSASLYQLHREFDYGNGTDGSWHWSGAGLPGSPALSGLRSVSPSLVQQENESLAIAALQLLEAHGYRVSPEQLRQGLAGLHWPGRMELLQGERGRRSLRFLLDGAHNPAGVENLAATLEQRFPGRRLALWGSMADKDIAPMLRRIAPLFTQLVFARPHGERSAEPETLLAQLPAAFRERAQCVREPEAALEKVCAQANAEDLIVVAGSLYLVGAIRPLLVGELA